MSKSYLKATALYTIGSFFNKAISLLLLPVFTRLLSTSSYGIVCTYNSWVNIAVVLVGVQFNLTLRSAYSDYKSELNQYICSINALSFFVCGAFLAIVIPITYFSLSGWVALLSFFCVLQAFLTSVINVEIQKQMMALEYVKRTLLLSLPNMFSAILGITAIILFPNLDYWGRIGTMIAVYILIGGYFLIKYCRIGLAGNISQYWKYALTFSLPLVFHGLANVLLSNIDQTMITCFRSSSETGIYSVAYTMGMALLAITSALESVWIPWFTKKMNCGDYDSVNQIGRLYIYSGGIACCLAVLCMPEILKFFTERSYWGAIYVLPPIIVASYVCFLFTISANTEYYYKQTRNIAYNTVVAAASNVVLNFLFIPKFGATAAAYTTVASYLVSFALHYRFARKLDNRIFNIKMFVMPTLIVLFVTIITCLWMESILCRWTFAMVFVALSVLYYLLNRRKFC